VRLDIVDRIGGHFFDERVFWSGDSEMNRRIGRAGLGVVQVSGAVLHHGPISFKHELQSGFQLGMSSRAEVDHGLREPYEQPRRLAGGALWWLHHKAPEIARAPFHDPMGRILRAGWKSMFLAGYYFFPHSAKRRANRTVRNVDGASY
jgi:GT2 family glycosyltransferase